MRWLVVTLAVLPLSLAAQSPAWNHVRLDSDSFSPASLSHAQKSKIELFLGRHLRADTDECLRAPGSSPPSFEDPGLGDSAIVLVTSGGGCGGMSTRPAWLVMLHAEQLRLLADVYGSGLMVQPTTHAGLHDFLLSWHMSGSETALQLFKYDGTTYHPIDSAIAYSNDEVGTERMDKERQHCAEAHKSCNLIRWDNRD